MAAIAVICFLFAVRFVTNNGITESFSLSTDGGRNDGHSPGYVSSEESFLNDENNNTVPTNPNHDICRLLSELAEYEKQVAGNMEKHDLYLKAVNVLTRFGTPIKSGEEARNYLGIGYQISNIIDEFLETGGLAKMSTNSNYDLCEILYELGNEEIKTSGNIHKYNAYRKAASSLSKHPTRITSGDEAQKLDGIGDSIGRKIDEFLKSENLRKSFANPNYDLCEYFSELGDHERTMSGNPKIYSVYRRAARILAKLSKPVKSGKEVKNLDGIDALIARKVDEFLETEKLRKLPSIPNYDLCEHFSKLSESEGKVIGNMRNYNTYRKASRILATIGTRIQSGEEARKLKGISDDISKEIGKFLEAEKKKKLPLNPNYHLCEFLSDLGEHERRVSGKTQKYDSYLKAALKLGSLKTQIRSGSQAKRLDEIDDHIAIKIDEFLETERLKSLLSNPNHDICELLIELSDYEKKINDDKEKQDQYLKAANALSKLNARIKSGKEAKKILGVSHQIASIIDEFLENGFMDTIAPNPNYDLCQILSELGNNEIKSSGDIQKYKNYQRAARELAKYSTRLQSGNEAKKIKGIDHDIAERIEEFLETEKLRKLPSNPNYDLCEYFSELSNYERKISGNTKMYIIYRNVARVLAKLGTQIKSDKEVQKLEGIDNNISKRINEFLETERLKKLPSNPNHDICQYLSELGNYERMVNGDLHMYKIYRMAVEVLTSAGKRIESGVEARKLEGISAKMAEKIQQFFNTEQTKQAEQVTTPVSHAPVNSSTAIKELTRVSGLGLSKAKQLYKQGITSIDLLIQKQNTTKLNKHQKLGIKYLYGFEKEMPRSDIYEIEKFIKITFNNYDPNYNISFCGNYRLGKKFIKDIVILVTHSKILSDSKNKNNDKFKMFVNILKKKNLITDTISMGETKFMGVCKINDIPRLLKIYFYSYDHYYCSMLYLTGNRLFYKRIKNHAKKKNFELTEYTLSPKYPTGMLGEPVILTSEEEIFEYLRYPYARPEERNVV